MGAPFHLHPFDVEPADAPLDLLPYQHGAELDAPHPMWVERRSPFWAAVADIAQDSRARIEVACGGFALLALILIVGRVLAAHFAGR